MEIKNAILLHEKGAAQKKKIQSRRAPIKVRCPPGPGRTARTRATAAAAGHPACSLSVGDDWATAAAALS